VPELPEVETVVREIRPSLVGRLITSIAVSRRPLRRRWSADWATVLRGARVTAVRRRGKWIVLDLAKDRYLVFHLGMTGQLTVAAARQPLPEHTHLVLGLDQGTRQLRFRDIRRFGSATLFPDRAHLEQFFEASGLGPEPFAVEADYWRTCLRRTSRCLKAVLLDQRVVAGVGNIYADESLFAARLHPARLGRSTTRPEAERLRSAMVDVLHGAIAKRGSSIRDYVGGSGRKGAFQEEFTVYGRTGQPCRSCRTPIRRIRLAGRSTHFCPDCQRGR
jgi:formamidopyrimidine-DNA glycosylase